VNADNTFDNIVTECQDRILRIIINRPQKKNALTRAMYAVMADAIRITKALLKKSLSQTILDTMVEERKHFSERLNSGECNEALTAFFERREPDFSAFK